MKKTAFFLFCALTLVMCAVFAHADTLPVITLQPQNPHFDESYVTFTVEVAGNDPQSTWYITYDGTEYEVYDDHHEMPWRKFVDTVVAEEVEDLGNGVRRFTMKLKTVDQGLDGSLVSCLITDGDYTVRSDEGYVTVGADGTPPTIKVPAKVKVYLSDNKRVEYAASVDFTQSQISEDLVPHISPDGKLTLTGIVASGEEGEQLDFVWYETSTGALPGIIALPQTNGFSNSVEVDVSSVGTRYYVLMAAGSKGGFAYSSVIPVTVVEGNAQVTEIRDEYIPAGVEGTEYNFKFNCTDKDATFGIWYDPGKANDFDKTGLTIEKDGTLHGTPTKAGAYEFTVCVSGSAGEDYKRFVFTVNENTSSNLGSETELGETAGETSGETSVTDTAIGGTTATDVTSSAEKSEGKTEKSSDNSGISVLTLVIVGVAAAAIGAAVAIFALKKKKK